MDLENSQIEELVRRSLRPDLLLDEDDPLLSEFEALADKGAMKLITFDDVGMEGTARFVYEWANRWVSWRRMGACGWRLLRFGRTRK